MSGLSPFGIGKAAWTAAFTNKEQVISIAGKGVGAGVKYVVKAEVEKKAGPVAAEVAGAAAGEAAEKVTEEMLDHAFDTAIAAVDAAKQKVEETREFCVAVAAVPRYVQYQADAKLGEYQSRVSNPYAKQGLTLVRRKVRGL